MVWIKSIILSNQGNLEMARQFAEKNVLSSNIINKINYDYLSRDYESIQKRLSNSSVKSVSNIWAYYPADYYYGIVSTYKNDKGKAIKYFDSSVSQLQSQIKTYPNDPRFHSALGFTYARLGQHDKAIISGLRATEILPASRDALFGPIYEKYLAGIYALVGESDKALDKIEYLTNIPGGFHYGELLYDPDFDSIRDKPRFQSALNRLKPKS